MAAGQITPSHRHPLDQKLNKRVEEACFELGIEKRCPPDRGVLCGVGHPGHRPTAGRTTLPDREPYPDRDLAMRLHSGGGSRRPQRNAP